MLKHARTAHANGYISDFCETYLPVSKFTITGMYRKKAVPRIKIRNIGEPSVHSKNNWIGTDGGVARYRLRLEPALALLGLRRDNYIFQDKSVRDIVQELLGNYRTT